MGIANESHKGFTLDIAQDEYPTCVFGSLVVMKEAGKKEFSVIEHIGW